MFYGMRHDCVNRVFKIMPLLIEANADLTRNYNDSHTFDGYSSVSVYAKSPSSSTGLTENQQKILLRTIQQQQDESQRRKVSSDDIVRDINVDAPQGRDAALDSDTDDSSE